jgi:hypothetical protein
MMNYYVITNQGRDNQLVGVDRDSGGYPFYTDDIRLAMLFPSIEGAQKYKEVFSRSKTPSEYDGNQWVINEVLFSFHEV